MSAVKVDGRRSYDRVRAGEESSSAARSVTVHGWTCTGSTRPTPDLVDVDVTVSCTAGTYIRAIARDAGAALGVGGHLTALRRTGSGPVRRRRWPRRWRTPPRPCWPAAGAGFAPAHRPRRPTVFPERRVTAAEAVDARLRPADPGHRRPGLHAAVDPDGRLVALVEDAGTTARVTVGFPA